MMIRLITAVADLISRDPAMRGKLQVVFYPNYNVKNAQAIFPGADLSEQISLAGKEASGTGNMKFQMNGALTIGTLDGANVEIREAVGEENFFLFGLTADQVMEHRSRGYSPRAIYEENTRVREVLDLISSGFFSAEDPGLFKPLTDHLLNDDTYMLLADFEDYATCQQRVSTAFADSKKWHTMAVRNIAKSGRFSSDRTIDEYAKDIWGVTPVPVQLRDGKLESW